MPRRARRQSQSGVYHIIIRGNNKKWIFKKEKYKLLMEKLIVEQVENGCIEVFAWCIMSNHAHVVVRGEKEDLAKAMANIDQYFAQKFNYYENTSGHVFQNRYKSECIEDERYLAGVIRYVHNNPVKAGIVSLVREYPWSSYRKYLNGMMPKQTIPIVERYFSGRISVFEEFHQQADEKEYKDIEEEVLLFRREKANRIIERVLRENGCSIVEEIKHKRFAWEMLILELVEKTNLTYRQIGKLLNIPYNQIYYTCNKYKT